MSSETDHISLVEEIARNNCPIFLTAAEGHHPDPCRICVRFAQALIDYQPVVIDAAVRAERARIVTLVEKMAFDADEGRKGANSVGGYALGGDYHRRTQAHRAVIDAITASDPPVVVWCDGDAVDNEHPPPLTGDVCPLCGSETETGFGLAGGGYGSYWTCSGDCPYFYKEQVTPESTPSAITFTEADIDPDAPVIITRFLDGTFTKPDEDPEQ